MSWHSGARAEFLESESIGFFAAQYLKMQTVISRDNEENGQNWKVSLANIC